MIGNADAESQDAMFIKKAKEGNRGVEVSDGKGIVS
jgi:hypothetical protein